jgi:uroporphyrinogen-III decarboxylase
MPKKMTPRERVLTALNGGIADRVPWVESYVHSSLVNKILGREVRPVPGARFALEIHEKLCLDNITYDFRPPIYAEIEWHGDLEMIKTPRLRTWEDLEAMKKWLPDPENDAFYENARRLLEQKRNYAAIAGLRLGISNVYNSMGYENFIYNLYDRPDFVTACFEAFGAWCTRVIERVNRMEFDAVWISEDIAFQNGPMVTLEQYENLIFPYAKRVAEKIEFPIIYHSDGNYLPVLDFILRYHPSGIANLEPPAMDIFKLKETHGKKVCLVGNIDLHYTLTRGTEEETRIEVREKLERVGKGGGYIIASANGLASYCKPENVLAMNETILRYGCYR